MPRSVRLVPCLLGVLVAMLGCAGPKVEVPPRVDLAEWRTIGIVDFRGGSDPELPELATRQFVQMIQSAQPGVRITRAIWCARLRISPRLA